MRSCVGSHMKGPFLNPATLMANVTVHYTTHLNDHESGFDQVSQHEVRSHTSEDVIHAPADIFR